MHFLSHIFQIIKCFFFSVFILQLYLYFRMLFSYELTRWCSAFTVEGAVKMAARVLPFSSKWGLLCGWALLWSPVPHLIWQNFARVNIWHKTAEPHAWWLKNWLLWASYLLAQHKTWHRWQLDRTAVAWWSTGSVKVKTKTCTGGVHK